ncbi:DUF6492 family protein [Pseudobacteriovorax antillogorgiicola]|uniref:Nucleotide-diphospho-sugar transferase n=1 Tax=Pseudobacteriovorax antillogorgiicola TaxID=1513793 RepID=A0A1Y6BVK6_9BACT|nr:DUF6492 family protein [Pseudobacteriovorax antillogorgiicola]TCS52269.1 hypothetical protein EDD56_10913 [Pseudobacteriovorax antillogorgiicola]SMF30899.1 hypothetical protein SAMN06296036_109200 [Pseudobacteriovorax antillogorgiicola]
MSKSFAIITPSYHVDAERCALLVDSFRKYITENAKHYIIVPKKDRALFEPMAGGRVEILFQDDLMPGWLLPLFFTSKWWLSLKTLPVRGWIRQQIVKLSAAIACDADYMLFMDSDCFFTRPFDPESLLDQEGRIPLFRETIEEIPKYRKWYECGAKILGINETIKVNLNYVGPFIFWTRADLLALLERLEQISGKSWQEVVCRQIDFSEYTVYGMFIEYIRRENSQHYHDNTIRTINYWPETPASFEDLLKLQGTISPEHFGAMISSKSNTPVESIVKAFNISA